MIHARGVVKLYGDRAVVNRADFVVLPGQITGIVGPSGSGKSTFLRLLAGLELPEEGEILIQGKKLTSDQLFAHRRYTTLVMQPPVLFRGTVADNLAYPLRVRRVSRKERQEAIEEALAAVGLSAFTHARAHTLSAGEAARVALMRALLARPRILLLDEPTGNLDPANVERIEDLIRQRLLQDSMTVVFITHNLAQARRLSQSVAVMLGGRIVEQGSPDKIFFSPSATEVAAYLRTEGLGIGESKTTSPFLPFPVSPFLLVRR